MKHSGPLLLPALVLITLGTARSLPLDWQTILKSFAKKTQAAVAYRETEHVGVLYGKIRASGLWCYERPDHLSDLMLTPVRKQYGMNRKEAWSINARGRRRTIDLALVPELRMLAQTLESLLSGQARTLHQLFHETQRVRPPEWTLTLTPRPDAGTRTLRSLRLRGRGSTLRDLTLLYRNGDWSHYRLTPVPWRACQNEGL
jgi:hypothetical protein